MLLPISVLIVYSPLMIPPSTCILPLPPFKFVRNKMYDVVADNRYSFLGKREDCRCSDDRYADRFI